MKSKYAAENDKKGIGSILRQYFDMDNYTEWKEVKIVQIKKKEIYFFILFMTVKTFPCATAKFHVWKK